MVDKEKFAEEDKEGYRFHIVGRSVLITDAMKNYVQEKLLKIDRFHTHVLDIHVWMDIQKVDHIVDILMKYSHFEIRVHAVTSDMYASIDKAVHRLQRKLRRWKERIQDHHNKPIHEVDMEVNVMEAFAEEEISELEEINDEIEKENEKKIDFVSPMTKLIGNETLSLKTLTSEEAVMKMELSEAPFMIFRGEDDHILKVIYRRDDGNYGIVQTN